MIRIPGKPVPPPPEPLNALGDGGTDAGVAAAGAAGLLFAVAINVIVVGGIVYLVYKAAK